MWLKILELPACVDSCEWPATLDRPADPICNCVVLPLRSPTGRVTTLRCARFISRTFCNIGLLSTDVRLLWQKGVKIARGKLFYLVDVKAY